MLLKVSEAKQVTEELLAEVRAALQFSQEAGDAITACFSLSGTFKVLDCVVTETSKATKEALSVVTSIRNKVVAVEKYLLLAASDLAQCAGATLLTAQERVAEILKNIAECVEGKLNVKNLDYKKPLLLEHSN